jgi:hypothetical protein
MSDELMNTCPQCREELELRGPRYWCSNPICLFTERVKDHVKRNLNRRCTDMTESTQRKFTELDWGRFNIIIDTAPGRFSLRVYKRIEGTWMSGTYTNIFRLKIGE